MPCGPPCAACRNDVLYATTEPWWGRIHRTFLHVWQEQYGVKIYVYISVRYIIWAGQVSGMSYRCQIPRQMICVDVMAGAMLSWKCGYSQQDLAFGAKNWINHNFQFWCWSYLAILRSQSKCDVKSESKTIPIWFQLHVEFFYWNHRISIPYP